MLHAVVLHAVMMLAVVSHTHCHTISFLATLTYFTATHCHTISFLATLTYFTATHCQTISFLATLTYFTATQSHNIHRTDQTKLHVTHVDPKSLLAVCTYSDSTLINTITVHNNSTLPSTGTGWQSQGVRGSSGHPNPHVLPMFIV